MSMRLRSVVLKQFAISLVLCAAALLASSAQAQNKFVMNEGQFNGWLFQGMGRAPDAESEVTLMVEAMDRSCHLTDEQKDKLRLAGQGDFARFDQQVNDLRSECIGKTYDQSEIQALYQKFQPLIVKYQGGMLGSTSLFAKVVHQMLTPEQREEYEAAEAERRKIRHVSKVRLFIALLEQSCPMKASQRDAMFDLLLKETKPALRSSEYDWYVVVVQVARIPDSKLKPILDRPQLTYLRKITGQARGMEGMLRQQGILPER